MKVLVLQDKLNTALKQFAKIVDKSPTLPVLGNVVLYPEDGNLVIGGTDLLHTLKMRIGAKVAMEGRGITLPYQTLSKLIAKLPAERIDIRVDYVYQTAYFECGSKKFELKGIDADEFPQLKDVPTQFEIMSDKLLAGINKVAYAICKQDNRPVLQCLSMMPVDGKFQLAAADGYRLAVTDVPVYDDLLPAEPFQALVNLHQLPGLIDFVKWAVAGGNMKSKFPEMLKLAYVDEDGFQKLGIATLNASYWVSLFTDGKFPEYQVIAKFSDPMEYKVYAADLISAVETASVYDAELIALEFNAPSVDLEVSSGSQERGQYAEMISVGGTESFKCCLNGKHILDSLKKLDAEQAILHLSRTGEDWHVVNIVDADGSVHTMMPFQWSVAFWKRERVEA